MTLETDLYEVLQPIIGGTVIWMDQNAPRPALPYTAMKRSARRRVHKDRYSDVDDTGIQTVAGDREFTLSIQRYQAYGPDSVMEELEDVVDKLQLQTNIDAFLAKGLAAFNTSPVMDISMLLDKTQIEKRSNVDVFFRYRSKLTDNVGLIESVHITGTDDGHGSPTYTIIANA